MNHMDFTHAQNLDFTAVISVFSSFSAAKGNDHTRETGNEFLEMAEVLRFRLVALAACSALSGYGMAELHQSRFGFQA